MTEDEIWNSLGQNTGVGSLSFLQGIFPTQGWNPGLPIFFQRLAAGHLKQKGPLSLTWGATRKLGARQTISDPGVSLGEGCQKEVECLAVDFNVTEMTVIAFAANIYCILTTEFSRRNKSRPRARGPRDHMDRKKKTSRGTGLHSRKRPCPGVGRLDLILSLPLTYVSYYFMICKMGLAEHTLCAYCRNQTGYYI